MTLRFARVSLGKDLKVHTGNHTASLQKGGGVVGEEENVLSTISHLATAPPTCQPPPPLPLCSGGGGGVDEGSSSTPNIRLQETRNVSGGGGVGGEVEGEFIVLHCGLAL